MRLRRLVLHLVFGLAFLWTGAPACAQHSDVAVVVSIRNPVNNLTGADLRKVFNGERRSWTVGLPIKIVVRGPGTREREALLKLLGMKETEYKQYWIAQVFRGEVDAEPITLPSVGMQLEALALFPGAITLVDSSDLKPGMKVLSVDNHLPNQAGYPLH